MEQYMDYQEGVAGLQEALHALGAASKALHERESGRENLSGPMAQILGGIQDSVSGLVDLLLEMAESTDDAATEISGNPEVASKSSREGWNDQVARD